MTGPTTTALYDWFARSAAAHPDAPALELDGTAYSYRQLERYAEVLSGRIVRAHGGAPPARVALLASRSLTAFAGYLAAQRLGATVTPLNPGYPAARNRTVCRLARTDVLVAERSALPPEGYAADGTVPVELVLTDEEVTAPAPADLPVPPPARAAADDVAYVLFTSGSTGRPKGVPVRHRNASAYVARNIERFRVGPGDRTSHTFDLTFDPSVHDLFVTWGAGATLVVPQRTDLLTPVEYLTRQAITHWFSVPSLVSVSAALGNLPAGQAPALRHGVFIGEQLTYRQARAWHDVAPGAVIDNVYGPTELTVACTAYRLPRDPQQWPATSNDTVPIGPVYDTLDHLVLDEDGHPADEGELCVRGVQRFDGYLDPDDDNERFLTHEDGRTEIHRGGPLTDAHYYRTGDRVRREQGTLLHLGRLDNQVKLRGYRVELGEIETALRRHPAVEEAVVLALPGTNGLEAVACYTGEPLERAAARGWLRAHVPPHMVPRRLVHLERLPLNPNGKIDRPALRRDLTADPTPTPAPAPAAAPTRLLPVG
ncbi:amino acid adenylation domain-containing protein [Streptantibioticus silvisoli]|uniref:Amino acid adenylation domain-containing protein n=1 Tax=Streptantibioticus silvisoli TaxID=2705255 RepID=A0ABT6W6Z6_9ACTN|nr:amino acid adenylation domain-containing protein [Streptantibioticus silvisoli]MDI5965433.1 amino acid adenylation domain-containing protein [Streptantibioticus silvisoli]